MGGISFKIMSEEYCEEYRENYSDFMEILKRSEFIGSVRGRAVSDRTSPSLAEPSAPLSAGLFGRATVPIPAT